MVIREMRDFDDCHDDGDDDGFDHNDDGPNHDHAGHEDDQRDGEEGEGYMLCTLMGSLRVAAFALEEQQASLDQLKGDRFIHGMSNLKKDRVGTGKSSTPLALRHCPYVLLPGWQVSRQYQKLRGWGSRLRLQ